MLEEECLPRPSRREEVQLSHSRRAIEDPQSIGALAAVSLIAARATHGPDVRLALYLQFVARGNPPARPAHPLHESSRVSCISIFTDTYPARRIDEKRNDGGRLFGSVLQDTPAPR